MKTFFKKCWPDIVYLLLAILLVVLTFVPMYNIVIENLNDEKEYFVFSIFDFIFGANILTSSFDGNIILMVVYSLFFIGIILYIIQLFINKDNENVRLVLNSITCALNIIFMIALLFAYVYVPLMNANLSAVQGFKKIEPIGWSYCLFMISNIVMILILLRKTAFQAKFSIYEISEIAIFCALALVLDKVKIPVGATGGSINASAVPLFIISIRYGPLKGLLASSFVFGLISCLLDGYGIQTYPFDYLIAFSGYASVGLFMNLFEKHVIKGRENIEFACICLSFVLGAFVSFLTRMLGSSISSMIFYEYSFGAALLYNLTYIPLSVFGCMVIALVLAKPIQVINNKFPVK